MTDLNKDLKLEAIQLLSRAIREKQYLTAADIANKAEKATTLAGYGITDADTSAQVDEKIRARLSSVHQGQGNATSYKQLLQDVANGTIVPENGWVYNILSADSDDVDESGHQVKTGDNVSYTGTGWDVLSGFVNLSPYAKTADVNSQLAGKVSVEAGKRLMTDAEGSKLAGISTGANRTAASTINGNVLVDGVEVPVYTPNFATAAEVNEVINAELNS